MQDADLLTDAEIAKVEAINISDIARERGITLIRRLVVADAGLLCDSPQSWRCPRHA